MPSKAVGLKLHPANHSKYSRSSRCQARWWCR